MYLTALDLAAIKITYFLVGADGGKEKAKMNGSFFRYVDKSGNMPILTYHSTYMKTHPYYVQYYNNKPVAYHGPINILCRDISGTKVWDYSTNSFIDIANLKAVV